MAKPGGKMSKSSQSLLVEAMQIVGDPFQRTETKRKTCTVQAGGYAAVELEDFEDRKKNQTVDQGGENCTNFRHMWSGNAK